MTIFRTFGQETDSTDDFRKLPGYADLTPAVQGKIQEAYDAAFRTRQHLGMKLAQGTAYATAKAIIDEHVLLEKKCSSCGRQMSEVKRQGATHKFCPTCNPKSMGYGEIKRVKECENDPKGAPEAKPATDKEKNTESKDQLNGVSEADGLVGRGANGGNVKQAGGSIRDYKKQLKGAGAPVKYIRKDVADIKSKHRLGEDDSGSTQRQNVSTKNAEEEPINPTKLTAWGKSPATPGGSESGTGAGEILKKNHAAESTTPREGYEGFNKLEKKLSHKKGIYDPAGLAASIGRKKYGSKGFSTHKHVAEGEINEVEVSHSSYKAGHRFGTKLGGGFVPDPTKSFHSGSVEHIKKLGGTLENKLEAQRHFKAGAHAGYMKAAGLTEESSKSIQDRNFTEKCDYCGKVHPVGPCPAMQESEWEGTSPSTPEPYECGGDWGEGPTVDAKSILNKNHKDKGEPVDESEWGEPEEHEAGATYEEVDPLLKAAVNCLANRVNVRGIAEAALPKKPEIRKKEKR